MFLKAKEYKVIDFFETHFVEIPEYQRPYCWEQEDAENLLNDLFDFFANPPSNHTEGMYFLGSIVLVGATRRTTRWKLLDGQQRLATLTMIFSAYRSLLSDQQYIDEIDQLIVVRRGGLLSPRRLEFRINLQKAPRIATEDFPDLTSDDAFFRHFIQEKGNLAELQFFGENRNNPVASQRRMTENALCIKKLLVEHHTSDPGRLIELMRFLVRNTYLVVAKTNNLDNAFKVFTVLNTRGIDLSAKDYLKAEVIGAVTSSNQTRYAEKWDDIESSFLGFMEKEGEGNLSALLEYLAFLTDRKPARENRQGELVSVLRKHYRDEKSVWGERFVDEVLGPYARAFYIIKWADLDPTVGAPDGSKHTDECNKQLRYLRQLSLHDDWLPFLLEIILIWGILNPKYQSKSDHERLSILLKALERRVLCYIVAGTQSKKRHELYSNLLDMLSGTSIDSIIAALELSDEEKAEMRNRLNASDFYLKKKYATYVLLRLDETFSDASAIYDKLPDVISLEHVLPQNPDPESDWITLFPDANERRNLTNCLGNLVLLPLPINIAGSNWPFAEKCEKYFFDKEKEVNPFAITNRILQFKQWTPEVIRERQEFLIERCEKIWGLN